MQKPLAPTPRIALLMQGIRKYERELIHGFANFSNLHGPWQFYRHVSYLPNEEISPQKLIQHWNPDALIIRESSPRCFDELLDRRVPTLYLPSTEINPHLPNIIVDDIAVGKLAAQHLHEQGIRNFAFCGINDLFFWSRLRCQGFCEKMHQYGHHVDVFESSKGKEFLSSNDEFSTLKNWLSKQEPQTGIFVCTDDFSLLVQEACLEIGKAVPEDIALIGVGNDESVCELATAPLSSIKLNLKRAGYDAAQFLAQKLKKNTLENKNITIGALEVVARRSTDATRSSDPQIASAISFIHQSINQPIDVIDVVDVVTISRRTLYDRFQAATGQTISTYIRQRRLEHFTRLLLETNLTISEIAYSMGYESDANVARYFKKKMGVTPLAYRRKHGQL